MSKQSRFLSLVLRHKPEEADLSLDAEGWASIGDIIKAVAKRYGVFTRDDLEELVHDNDKQRFIIKGDKIRANQGHSIDVDLKLEPMTPPPILFHGTKTKFLRSIMEQGLVPGKRRHVHLSPNTETAEIVASRREGGSVILQINTTAVSSPFYHSENGVWLTHHVEPLAIMFLDYGIFDDAET